MKPPIPMPARTACLLLALLVFAVFGQSLSFGFIHYDDPLLVTDNYRVLRGLSFDNVVWAFTTGYTGNWHPITWLSHMLDIELYGLNAGAHRLTNILVHLASACVLFSFLSTATAAPGRSAAVAALFAIHPLHVESVVWIAERKDVLCGLFWMLTLLAYARWASRPSALRYAWILLAFAAALMSKAMAVTLPFALLLMDAWPLRRMESRSDFFRRVREKIPLFAAAGFLSFIAFQTQHAAGATESLRGLSLPIRIANGAISYGAYLAKTVWPVDLAVFYPHPGGTPSLVLLSASILAIALITAAAWAVRARVPAILIGWLWYLGTLVPVIGIVQIGDQSLADRYTYIPLVGVFIAAAWGAAGATPKFARTTTARHARAIGALACLALGAASWHQVHYWRDNVALFEHALAVSGGHPTIRNALGRAYYSEHRRGDAENQYRLALEALPSFSMANNNLGLIYLDSSRYAEAEEVFRSATEVTPDESLFFANLGIALAQQQKTVEAEAAMREAIKLDPENLAARRNLFAFLERQLRYEDAEEAIAALVAIDPGNVPWLYRWAGVLTKLGRVDEAQQRLDEAKKIAPDFTMPVN